MCRYRYISKVSDTDTVSNTKGLAESLSNVNKQTHLHARNPRKEPLESEREENEWNSQLQENQTRCKNREDWGR